MNSPAFFKVKDDPESRKDWFFNQDGFQSGKAKYDVSTCEAKEDGEAT